MNNKRLVQLLEDIADGEDIDQEKMELNREELREFAKKFMTQFNKLSTKIWDNKSIDDFQHALRFEFKKEK
jgi:hypothetical protein